MRMSRFERKISAAMALVALAPLVGALLFGRSALRDAYSVGINERIEAQLERSVDQIQEHLSALRADAERTTDAIAFHHSVRANLGGELQPVLDELLARYPHVAEIRVATSERAVSAARRASEGRPLMLTRWLSLDEATVAGVEPPPREDASPDDGDPYGDEEDLEEPIEHVDEDADEIPPGYAEVRVVVEAPEDLFHELQNAGEEAELYSRWQEQTGYVSETFLYLYVGALAIVIVLAMAIGVAVSRRVTRGVVDLANATRRVGAGDLEVHVESHGADEVQELTEAFNAMVKDLRDSRVRIEYLQRIGAWQQFARRLAHEIKNPLTPIQLAAQEMHRSYDGNDPKYQRKLEDARAIIEEEVETLRRLVGEFSSFAKLPTAELEEADLRDFLADVKRTLPAILEDVFPDGGAPEAEVESDDAEMPARIDAMMLKRCVDNLVRNGAQAIRDGGGGRLWVRASRSSAGVRLEVEDDGPGIPEAKRERVFDPYFTTKSDGTGLGLAIVKKIVLEHGGEIRCEAGDEGGARFVIELPEAS